MELVLSNMKVQLTLLKHLRLQTVDIWMIDKCGVNSLVNKLVEATDNKVVLQESLIRFSVAMLASILKNRLCATFSHKQEQ